jgi:SAM-dependent methyltransferase
VAERVGLGAGEDLSGHVARYALALPYAIGADVLDAGCGEGYGTRTLAAVARSVVALDQVLPPEFASRPAVRGDVRRMPLRDASFDMATCFEVIEHVRDQAALVAELARVLRPGGYAFVSTPHATIEHLHDRARDTANEFHIALVTPRRLRALLRASFADVELLGQVDTRGVVGDVLRAADLPRLHLRLRARRAPAARPAAPATVPEEAQRERRDRPRSVFTRVGVETAPALVAICRKAG